MNVTITELTCEEHALLYTPDPPQCLAPAPMPTTATTVHVTELPSTGSTPDLAQNLAIVAALIVLIGFVALCARVRQEE